MIHGAISVGNAHAESAGTSAVCIAFKNWIKFDGGSLRCGECGDGQRSNSLDKSARGQRIELIMTRAHHTDFTHGIGDDKQNVQPMIQRRLPRTSESVHCDCPNSMRRSETMLTICAISIDVGQAHVWIQNAVPTQSPQLPRPNPSPRSRHRARAPAQTATTSPAAKACG